MRAEHFLYFKTRRILSEDLLLKLFSEEKKNLTVLGRVFHSFGAEYENDLSNTDDRDLGTTNVPLRIIKHVSEIECTQVCLICPAGILSRNNDLTSHRCWYNVVVVV